MGPRVAYLSKLIHDLEVANDDHDEACKYRDDAREAYEELADDARAAYVRLERVRKELLDFIEAQSTETQQVAA